MGAIIKLTWRSIRSFFGRYMAVVLIVALSAGFFAGLKITKRAMVETADAYLSQQNFHDFRVISSLGIPEDQLEAFSDLEEVEAAEGLYGTDVMADCLGQEYLLHAFSLPQQLDKPVLTAGRLPETPEECLADERLFSENALGRELSVTQSGSTGLETGTYRIVGLARSPRYLGIDRGTSALGGGSVNGFICLPKQAFSMDQYTEAVLTMTQTEALYSDAYDQAVASVKPIVVNRAEDLAWERYEQLLEQLPLTPQMEAMGLTRLDLAQEAGLKAPDVYVLTREENAGYVSFESDTSIVSGIANIFPVFFLAIAMLVCMTTMSRMVDEERTQIGVLKAMGFGNGAITVKYLLYAATAAVLGWASGFFLCTWGIPIIFWSAYSSLYDFAPIRWCFDPVLAVLTLEVSVLCMLISTWIACRKELVGMPALLIRPRRDRGGKRILLEHITFFWKKLPFLQKITLRNMFRYKQRLIMMLVGIGCCAGLVVTAFGVRDSMIHVTEEQFTQIQTYQLEVSVEPEAASELQTQLHEMDRIQKLTCCAARRGELMGSSISPATILSFERWEDASGFWSFCENNVPIELPREGEVAVSIGAAENQKVAPGDTVELQTGSQKTAALTISAVFDCRIENYVLLSRQTWEDQFGPWETERILLMLQPGEDPLEAAKAVAALDGVTGVKQLTQVRSSVDDALSCLNYIIWLIVLFSGALAFIVIYNLTNINLAERSREIATVQVLGFYPRETESYILRENLVLSVLGAMAGLPLGTLFHRIVMDMIVIEQLHFPAAVTPLSYAAAFLCTICFALVVNAVMKRQIGKVNMTESLKAVE